MFYQPGVTPHGLPHDPFKSCVIPRPIGWIATVDAQGRHNLAPFSQFQNVTCCWRAWRVLPTKFARQSIPETLQ